MLTFIGSQRKKGAVDTVRHRSAGCLSSEGGWIEASMCWETAGPVRADVRLMTGQCALACFLLLEQSTDWIVYKYISYSSAGWEVQGLVTDIW